MNTPALSQSYQPLSPSPFATEFWDFYRTLTNIEARFDLIHRRDGGVAVWTANRVRHYYDFAAQTGLYNTQDAANAPSVGPPQTPSVPDPVDLIIQTGAGGPAALNRTRGLGCIYTADMIQQCLAEGQRVLVVHDAPEALESHPNLLPVTFRDFRIWGTQLAKEIKVTPHVLTPEDETYWNAVNAALLEELGVTAPDLKRITALVNSHRRATLQHGALLDRLQPNASIMMTHYLRAPQIEAAQKRRIWTVDYQHGIHSRYHMGYGYPGLCPDARDVPYLPNEHWQWGRAWTSPSWWPAPLKQRITGLSQQSQQNNELTPLDTRPEKTLLIASSWAMRDSYRSVIRTLAAQAPDWTFRIKLHPREKVAQYADLAETFSNVEVISGDVDIHQAARAVRYVVSICSTSLFDVLLDGCRIAVLDLPSVEYAEDFVNDHGVPVLESDGSNFETVVKALAQQHIATDRIFYSMKPIERRLLSESLSIQAKMLRPGALPPTKPKYSIKRQCWTIGAPVALRVLGLSQAHDIASIKKVDTFRWGQKPREYLTALRKELEAEQENALSLRAKTHLLNTALNEGIPPVYLIASIREVLIAEQEHPSKAGKSLLQKVHATTDLGSAPLRAELLEHIKLISPHTIQEAPWKDGALKLKSISTGFARMTKLYEENIGASHAAFPDTRVCTTQQNALAQTLVERLSQPEPFSMLRLGDGEAYAFEPDYVPLQTLEKDRAIREQIWWSNTLEPALRARLQVGVQNAIENADFLGFPSIWRLLRDLPHQLGSLRGPIESWTATARAHQILSEELAQMTREGRLDWSHKTILDDRCHQELFTKQGITRFLNSGRPAVLVSCFEKEQINAAFGASVFDDAIRLPPHSKVRHAVPNDAIARARMPDMMDDLLEQIDQQARHGSVFFVAGGLAGKLLIDQAKRSGGAALDIGAVADYWMGLSTRGPLDFTQFKDRKGTP